MQKHLCGGKRRPWSYCVVCDGRIHEPECQAKRKPETDCCRERHRRLFEQGQTLGIADSSLPMFDETNKTWEGD